MIWERWGPLALLLLTLLAAVGCRDLPRAGKPLDRLGDEISVAGQLFHTGTRVVLWNDPGGYDAYRAHCHFEPRRAEPRQAEGRFARYGSLRDGLPEDLGARVRKQGWTVDDLGQVVRQVVIHYDASGTSRRCFEVLHDIRGLSCHFLLDLDGTIYQTLDLKERAWHAAEANGRSVGIEIANIGAYSGREHDALETWYEESAEGTRIVLPPDHDPGRLPRDLDARPARSAPIRGSIQGQIVWQYDFTESQYRALERLLVTLCRVLPGIEPRVPRDEMGRVPPGVLGEDERREYRGVLGHYHLSPKKIDPGPAFDWLRIETTLQRELGSSREDVD